MCEIYCSLHSAKYWQDVVILSDGRDTSIQSIHSFIIHHSSFHSLFLYSFLHHSLLIHFFNIIVFICSSWLYSFLHQLFIYSFNIIYLFIHLLIHLFIAKHLYSFIHYSYIHPITNSFIINLFIYWFKIHSFIHWKLF